MPFALLQGTEFFCSSLRMEELQSCSKTPWPHPPSCTPLVSAWRQGLPRVPCRPLEQLSICSMQDPCLASAANATKCTTLPNPGLLRGRRKGIAIGDFNHVSPGSFTSASPPFLRSAACATRLQISGYCALDDFARFVANRHRQCRELRRRWIPLLLHRMVLDSFPFRCSRLWQVRASIYPTIPRHRCILKFTSSIQASIVCSCSHSHRSEGE